MKTSHRFPIRLHAKVEVMQKTIDRVGEWMLPGVGAGRSAPGIRFGMVRLEQNVER
jgi:hypothetical protein